MANHDGESATITGIEHSQKELGIDGDILEYIP